MAIIQEIKDGKFVEDASEAASSNRNGKKKNVDNNMGQDQFLQLLVAQMQYQDPLEPTSNTEWVAQLATFSMVESLNSMQEAFNKQSANDLVGKYVFINDGENGYIRGKVDFITKQNGETKLSVDDKLYSLDKLDTVADEEYYQGAILANEWHQMVKLLPDEDNLTIKDAGLLRTAREEYDKMTDTQKQFVEKDVLEKFQKLEVRMDALKATEFVGEVRKLPLISDIETADEETLAKYSGQLTKLKELQDALTEKQRKLITDKTFETVQAVEDAVKEATKKLKPDDGTGSDAPDDVSALLQKILDELKAQKQNGTADS